MKLLPILCILFCLAQGVSSQIYTYTSTVGQRQFVADLRPNAVNVYPPPKNDVLSEWQDLPFAWNFFGKPVTGFFISDNGYLTFDSGATISDNANTALPSASAPRNAIFAFWEDLYTQAGSPQWSNEVRSLLWGTAPNRVLVIMWTGVAVVGARYSSSNTLAFCIAIHEGGGFDVVFVGGNTTIRTSATIGVQNEDGSVGVMVEGSPDFRYPAVTADPNDDISYRFSWSSNAVDLGVNAHWLPQTAVINTPVTVRGAVKNLGSEKIASFDLSYSVDGGAEVTDSFNGLDIPSNGTYNFMHSMPWTPTEAGRFHDVRLSIGNVNGGGTDTNPDNDVITARVFTQLGNTGVKRPLIEEFTGAWCGWCPDGAVQMQLIESAMPGAVLLAIHAGGVDSMIVPEGAEIASAFSPSYPQAMIDRTLFPGQVKVPINRTGGAWLNRAQQQEALETPLSLLIEPAFNPSDRTADVKVTVRFDDFLYPGDARLNVFLVEDRISGAGRGWDQNNSYSNNSSYPDHPYYGESNPIVGFVHRHVLRASLTGAWGVQIPGGIQAGSAWDKTFLYSIPDNWKEADVGVIAFVSYHDTDVTKRRIVNAQEAHLLHQTSVRNSLPGVFSAGEAYPSPAHGTAFLRLDLPEAARVRAEVIDALGRSADVSLDARLEAGVHHLKLASALLRPGAYIVRIDAGGSSVFRKMVVAR